jgi:toxin FitB
MFVLDTNVLAELMRLRPDPTMLARVGAIPKDQFWTCSVVIAEIVSGLELMTSGRRKDILSEAFEQMLAEDLAGRILNFDVATGRRYGEIISRRRNIGRPIRELDAQIAAIASVHRATVATRNVRDFEHCGVEVVNPWLTV